LGRLLHLEGLRPGVEFSFVVSLKTLDGGLMRSAKLFGCRLEFLSECLKVLTMGVTCFVLHNENDSTTLINKEAHFCTLKGLLQELLVLILYCLNLGIIHSFLGLENHFMNIA
jgi:hypothetical protein